MAPRPTPPEQLDIPLVWERDGGVHRPTTHHPPGGAAGPTPSATLWRLWIGMLADAGVVLLGVGSFWALAAVLGAALRPPGMVVAGLAGLECASVAGVGCLWVWRGSPGMLLVRVCFARPLPLGRAFGLWLVWLASLLAAGAPLLLRRRGECVAERLAGGTLSYRLIPGSA